MITPAQIRATNKYKKIHYKRLICVIPKEYYSDILRPFLADKQLSISEFIKRCMAYVIENNIKL